MIDTPNITETKNIPVNAFLTKELSKFKPAEIHSIGIDVKNMALAITVVPTKTFDNIKGRQVIQFLHQTGIVYMRGLVKQNGQVLTGFDKGFYAKYPELANQVVLAVKEAWGNDLHGLYLASPDRAYDFYLIRGTDWRPIEADTASIIEGDHILTAFNGKLRGLTTKDIENYFLTGNAEWKNVVGIDEEIAYIGGSARPVFTFKNGEIVTASLKFQENVFKAVNVTPWQNRTAQQMFGKVNGYPDIAAAVTTRTPNEVTVELFPAEL